MNKEFNIPVDDNEITEEDIEKNCLRITVGNKEHFPTKDCEITIRIGAAETRKRYKYIKNKSSKIYLGTEWMNRLGVEAFGSVKILKEGYKQYRMSV